MNNDLKPAMDNELDQVKKFLKEKRLYNYFTLIENELKLIAKGEPDKPGFATREEQIQYWMDDIRKIDGELTGVINNCKEALTKMEQDLEDTFKVVLAGIGKILPYDVNPAHYKEYFRCKNWKNKEIFNKNFFHYIERVPGETHETFENYEKQFNYYLASALRYPFRILPFYHYDPRRHFTGGLEKVDKLIDQITADHRFFIYKRGGLEKPEIMIQ
jgi:hypothetical protein